METNGPQRLPNKTAVECAVCHRRVYFKRYAQSPTADKRWMAVYLKCPCCGATAMQMREIVDEKPTRTAVKKRYRYVS